MGATVIAANGSLNAELGFSLLEVLLVLCCLSTLMLVLFASYLQLQHFSIQITERVAQVQKNGMIQRWLQQAKRQAGFLGCQQNTQAFQSMQSHTMQAFLQHHQPLIHYRKIKNTWHPEMPSYLRTYLIRGELLESQGMRIGTIAWQRVGSHTLELHLDWQPETMPLFLTDCHYFKRVNPEKLLALGEGRYQWKDSVPFLDLHYVQLGVWQRSAYFQGAHASFYRKIQGHPIEKLLS